ncbi:S66 family peptidase [Ornithinimicrobium kibberense]|uniref:S66 peptidase family protein n=1 Tax=Ornithinimicrobium kibberense TaxID=282060 RepID=A0ABV5V5B7_9MICO|nr:S66 peptidase family protein [Ornithinimicrobium kibberense]
MTRYPAPLRPGDVVGVTAPSSGVGPALRPRLEVALGSLRDQGYAVRLGRCLDGTGVVSAPAADRAAELEEMLCDPEVQAVVPPWGGELAVDLLHLVDWEWVAGAEPTWVVGYSDISTVITPLTLLTGWASVHGANLMDTPFRQPDGLVTWQRLCASAPGAEVEQRSPGRFQDAVLVDFAEHPGAVELPLDAQGTWERLDSDEPVRLTGRLLGGCVETLTNLTGTRYLDVGSWADRHAPEGVLVYLEAAGEDALTIGRHLHGLRLAGFFDRAVGVLVGRTSAPDADGYTQREAVLDALGPLGLPLVGGVECGHVAPRMPMVNGALATAEWSPGRGVLTQRFV